MDTLERPAPAEPEPSPAPEPEPEPGGEKQTTVPLSALLGEREKFQARESQLRETLQATQAQLAEIQKKVERKVSEAPLDEKEKARREWSAFLGLDKYEERMARIDTALEKLERLEAEVPAIKHGSELAFTNYTNSVEAYVASQYDPKSMGVNQKAWQNMVASEMTDREVEAIRNGNPGVIQDVIKRVKEQFTPGAMATRQRSFDSVRRLPKTPGPGGGAPHPGPDEKPFTSLRDLHKQAGEDFMRIKERDQ